MNYATAKAGIIGLTKTVAKVGERATSCDWTGLSTGTVISFFTANTDPALNIIFFVCLP